MQSKKPTSEFREPWKHQPHSPETNAKIAATMRGNTNRNGYRKPAEKRVRVAPVGFRPEVFAALEKLTAETGETRARAVNRLLAAALGVKL